MSHASVHALPIDRQILIPFRSPDPSADLFLDGVFRSDEFQRPLARTSDAHRAIFRRTLALWRNCFGSAEPTHAQIEVEHLAAFQEWLIARRYAPTTINKVCQYASQIIQFGNGRSISIDRLDCDYAPPRTASLEELSAIYRACSAAVWPKHPLIPAPLWWRTLLVLAFTYGPRLGDLAPIDCDSPGLAWSGIRFEADCPDQRMKDRSEHGWLVFTPLKTRRRKPAPLILPLSSAARRHLEALPRVGGRVLACRKNPRSFRRELRAIQILALFRAAGHSAMRTSNGRFRIDGRSLILREALRSLNDMHQRPYTIQDIRKTSDTYWFRACPGIQEHVLGHAPRGVNARHYVNPIPVLVKAIGLLEQPEAFSEGP